jgi:dTDP-4-amino-4,6-dideoxygalactose transaminase
MWRLHSEASVRLISSFRKAINPAKFLIPVSSATAGLHICLAYYTRQRGPHVLVPSFTWYVVPATVLNCGGKPVFADLTLPSLRLAEFDKIAAKEIGCAVISHLFGIPSLTRHHLNWLRKSGVPLVEDCAQCVAGDMDGTPVGRLGDVAVYSFNGSKHIPAGEGGMIATDNERIAKFADNFVMSVASPQGMKVRRFNSASEGWNYRLDAISASLAESLIHSLPRRIETASNAAIRIIDNLKGMSSIQVTGQPFPHHCAHLGLPIFVTRSIDGFSLRESRDILFFMLRLAGIGASVWVPEPMQATKRMRAFFQSGGGKPSPDDYRNAASFANRHLIVPTNQHMVDVCDNGRFSAVLELYEAISSRN